jgi:tetratricopeptide (TPR) repeat protein
MPAKVCLIIGVLGLNICFAAEQELFAKGRYIEAEKEASEGLRAAWKSGALDAGLARAWNNLAVIENAMGRATDAEKHFLGAIAVWEKIVPPDDPDLAASWSNLGEVYLSSGRIREARPLLERAVAVYEKAGGPNDRRLAPVLGRKAGRTTPSD